MGTFRCQNDKCNKDSDYSLAEVHTKNSFVLCQFCNAKHHLHVSSNKPGDPLVFVAGGIYERPL